MAEQTVSRTTLRRAIGRKAGMQFYVKYPQSYLNVTDGSDTAASTCTKSDIFCTDLTQEDHHWKGYYFYLLDASTTSAAGEEREVVGSNRNDQRLKLEWDLSAIPAASDDFELLYPWSANQIHDEINNVIRESWRVFPTVKTDEKLVIQEDKLKYSTSDFDPLPAYILTIEAERGYTRYTGYASSGDTSGPTWTATDLGVDSTDLSTDYYWSFYYGTGAGQSGEVVSGDSDNKITVSASDFANYPDTTTKYCVWKYMEEEENWYPLTSVRYNEVEWPGHFYLTDDYSNVHGMRLRVKYLAGYATLSCDAATTTIPRFYVVHKALAFLHDTLVGDNRRDRQMHAGLAEYYDALAERFAQKNKRILPPGTIWDEDEYIGYQDIDNPLGW